MAEITTRVGKGSPLTNDEVDANFVNLNEELAVFHTVSGASSSVVAAEASVYYSARLLDTSGAVVLAIYGSDGTTLAANVYHTPGGTTGFEAQHVTAFLPEAASLQYAYTTTGRVRLSGSAALESIYVGAKSYVHAISLLGGFDQVFLPGALADYAISVTEISGAITLRKFYTDGSVEGAVVSNGGLAAGRDWLVFSNGRIQTNTLKAAIDAGTTPVLDATLTSPPTPPGGCVQIYGFPTCEVLADGRAVRRAEFPALFARTGTRFGAGDGTNTFNVPAMPSIGVTGVNSYIRA